MTEYAKANGITLSSAEKKELASIADQQLQQLTEAAKSNSVSLSTYLGYVFGSGVNGAVIRSGLEDNLLAQKVVFAKNCEFVPTAE